MIVICHHGSARLFTERGTRADRHYILGRQVILGSATSIDKLTEIRLKRRVRTEPLDERPGVLFSDNTLKRGEDHAKRAINLIVYWHCPILPANAVLIF